MTQRRAITAGPAPIGPYSPAIVSGGLIFVSGILASDAAGRISGDIIAQTRRVLDRLAEVLAAAGAIVQVEARHAAAIRLLRGENPAPMGFDQTLTEDEVLMAVKPFVKS